MANNAGEGLRVEVQRTLEELLTALDEAVRETGSLNSERVLKLSAALDAWVLAQMRRPLPAAEPADPPHR